MLWAPLLGAARYDNVSGWAGGMVLTLPAH